MILPICGQESLVTLPGTPQQILGEARAPYIDSTGRYHIMVYSRHWGYERHFPAPAIMLLPKALPGGVEYDAEAAFRAMYSAEQIDAMIEAENAAAPTKKQILPAAPKAAARTRRVAQPSPELEAALQSIANIARPQRVVRKPRG